MASLYIKDRETAALAAELAAELGTTKTEAVRDALRRRIAEIAAPKSGSGQGLLERLDEWRKANPLPPPTGLKADKAFFDDLWGEI
ncbi:type II toxin-antitoxin system VapB family antitoxin [Sphingomonas canadensis]|uniref:Type II toxin-antitoxin system VapB family antitoxin n=1 Tax=Sphingomonas canadensis TaxID=1219257 RepID=A0ABW3HEP0_9SPHN|nr:type II toxin-antitoxin system VapB family antitoxin [Sphingomonas canadensis]MCW3838385.1 type II toxin-antitoxin system VapB family antitoxin [Sphingomonas canadensis]